MLTTMSRYGKTYTINIDGKSVYYNIQDWRIAESDRLEFKDGDKTIITTLRYTIEEE